MYTTKYSKKILSIMMIIVFLFSLLGNQIVVQATDNQNVRAIYGGFYDDYGYKIIPLGKKFTLGPVMGHYNDSITNVSWSTTNKSVVGLINVWDRYCNVKASGEGICSVNGVAESYYALMGDLKYMDNIHKFRVAKPVTSINVKNQTATLGKTKQLKVTSTPSSRYSLFASNVEFKSSNTKIATIDKVGNITAKKSGKCVITVTADGGIKQSCKLTVKRPAVKKVKLDKTSVTLIKGKTKKLKATILPNGAKSRIKWISSNKKVATVSSKGIIKAKKEGATKITAMINSKIKAVCKVKVPKSPKKIVFTKTKITLTKGKTYTIKYKITPKKAYEKITWSSSNKSVARVNTKGEVTAVKAGTSNITAKTYNGKKAVCKIIVKNPFVEPTEKPIETPIESTPLPTEPFTTETVSTEATETATPTENNQVTFDVSKGEVCINEDNTITQNDVTTTKVYEKIIITQSNPDPYLSGGVTVKSEGDIHIVLDNVNLKYGITILGNSRTTNLTIEVKEGTHNYLGKGLWEWRKSLTLQGNGWLEIESIETTAIEGSNILIKDMELTATITGVSDDAVIGSCAGEDCDNIKITESAKVTAVGGYKAIGAGKDGAETNITIAAGVLNYKATV